MEGDFSRWQSASPAMESVFSPVGTRGSCSSARGPEETSGPTATTTSSSSRAPWPRPGSAPRRRGGRTSGRCQGPRAVPGTSNGGLRARVVGTRMDHSVVSGRADPEGNTCVHVAPHHSVPAAPGRTPTQLHGFRSTWHLALPHLALPWARGSSSCSPSCWEGSAGPCSGHSSPSQLPRAASPARPWRAWLPPSRPGRPAGPA